MLTETNVVGKKVDWADYITLADEHETPALRLLSKGQQPVELVKHYQADKFDDPTPVASVDGQDITEFNSAGKNRVELQARCQKITKTASVSDFAENVATAAGVADELAREITKKMTEMSRTIECAACSDQLAYADDGTKGNQFRSIGAWISSTPVTDADKAVDASIAPAAAQVTTTATGSQTEDNFKLILESAWSNTGSQGRKLCLLGSKAKKLFGNFQFYLPTSNSTQSTARVTMREQGDKTVGDTVDVYHSDWGDVELHMTKWNQQANFTGGSATYSQWRTYVLNQDRWSWFWHRKPTVNKPPYLGGGYKAFIEAIIMLGCLNPIGEGAWKPAS